MTPGEIGLTIGLISRTDSFTEIHLCPACEDELEGWLKDYGTVPSTPI